MELDKYKSLTKKQPPKIKPRNTPLPKAKQKYLEAEETLAQQLDELCISYRRKYRFEPTKHWRFDFYIVKKRLLIEIAGGPWSGGRSGKLANKAWSMSRYDVAEDMGFKIRRFEPDQVESNFTIAWIQQELDE